ncbi:uncharacterized protein isoform X2 [Danio rerio]|uniref:Uncharacterized protein isoform X2 n=1 Tax=Danio rerio TaxID=7955 RepID=A0AC58J9J8_DANRE
MDVCCGQSIDLLKRTPENTRIMRYHIVCCRTLLPQDLMQPRNLTTLSGDILSITYSEKLQFFTHSTRRQKQCSARLNTNQVGRRRTSDDSSTLVMTTMRDVFGPYSQQKQSSGTFGLHLLA